MALQVLEQLFRVSVLRKQSQRFMHHREALLKLAALVVQVGQVEDGLEEIIRRLLRLHKVVL